ncbi:putative defense protein 3 [Pelodytes ibericus]
MDPYFKNVLLLLVVFSPLHVAAYPNGQVQASCTSMEPSHGTTGQSSSPPYSLVLSSTTYSAGGKITVTLSTNSGSPQFTGFLIQARDGTSSIPQGSFQILTADTQTLTCTTAASAVSHTTNSAKSSVQVTWVAPNNNVADLQFRATVVQVERTYWTNVVSSKLTYVTTATTVGSNAANSSTSTAINYSTNVSTQSTSTKSTNTTTTPKQSYDINNGFRFSVSIIVRVSYR